VPTKQIGPLRVAGHIAKIGEWHITMLDLSLINYGMNSGNYCKREINVLYCQIFDGTKKKECKMTEKIVTITEKRKTNVVGVDIRVTVGNHTTFREVVQVVDGWAVVDPFKMPDTSKLFSTKDEAIKAVSNLEV
jgi:hypothetical protein